MIYKHRFTLLPFISALALAAANQYPACFFLSWLALIPLFYCLCLRDKLAKRQIITTLIIFAATYYLVLLTFLFALHPLDYLGFSHQASLALLTLGWLLLTAGITAGFILLGLAYSKLRPQNAAGSVILLCALWLLLEWVQGLTPMGFTWGRLAVAQAAQPLLIQGAALGGSLFVSALVLTVNGLLTMAWHKKCKVLALLAIAVFGLNLAGGAIRLSAAQPGDTPRLKVGIIQGTLPSQLKWDENTGAYNRAQYYSQSMAAAKAGAELILWPETSLAEEIYAAQIPRDNLYQQLVRDSGVPLIAGAGWRQTNGIAYNALVYATFDSLQFVYGKRHLVPFGEYVPLGSLIEPLLPGLSTLMSEGLIPYEGDGLIRAGNTGLGGLICFESIFSPLARTSVAAGAEALVLGSNDSWFWGTPAMRQHYWQAQLRAVEQNRYVLRAANAGYSGIIDNFGRSLEEIAPRDSGFLLADTPLLTSHTPYFYLREWLLIAAVIIIIQYMWRKL